MSGETVTNIIIMVYIFGIIGLVFGFSVGLGTINVILRNRSKKEIQEDSSLRWKYGLLVWLIAGFGCWIGIYLYNHSNF